MDSDPGSSPAFVSHASGFGASGFGASGSNRADVDRDPARVRVPALPPDLPLALTLGDPAGVGPEIACAAWQALRGKAHKNGPDAALEPVFYLVAPMAWAIAFGARFNTPMAQIAHAGEARAVFPQALPVFSIEDGGLDLPAPGSPDVACAPVIIASIERAVGDVLVGRAGGVVTCPIAKHVLYQAGFSHPGHTEYLAALTHDAPVSGPRGPVMMLANSQLRASLVTIHTPLSDVPAMITPERVEHVIRVTHHAMVHDFGVARPRIALCGLNPHAGEDGALGREERDILNPLAARLRADGLDVSDAQASDTLFTPEARAGYDVAVAMYHDQGLIPVKTLDFHGAVNVTLGLPVVRTSPDHGTGFSIAGQGRARADSVIAALHEAHSMARVRARAAAVGSAPEGCA